MEDAKGASSLSTMMDRLEACCNELLSEIEMKHTVLKSSFGKPVNEDAKRNRRKSELRKSVTNIGNTTRSLSLLTGYIDSLDNLKTKYIKYFIDAIRNEIEILWDNCCYGEEQRSACSAYFLDIFTEESLQEHEQELKTLKGHYYSHKDLYTLVSKREKLWQEKVAFENPPDGCSRFENRGGTLIKELKRYQVVEKQLPITEKQIRSKLKNWEKVNKTVFLVHDAPYIKHIESQKLDYKAQQERKREAKRIAKQEELLAELSQSVNPVTKRSSVYDNSLSKTVCKEFSEESLKELMKPTESSLLKTRYCATPATTGLSQLSTINEASVKNNIPDSKIQRLRKTTSTEEGLPSKLSKMDLSCNSIMAPKSVKSLSTSRSEGKVVTDELLREIARPTASSLLKSRLPKKNSSNVPTKRKVTLQTDPLKKKQRRRSVVGKNRSSLKENYRSDTDS